MPCVRASLCQSAQVCVKYVSMCVLAAKCQSGASCSAGSHSVWTLQSEGNSRRAAIDPNSAPASLSASSCLLPRLHLHLHLRVALASIDRQPGRVPLHPSQVKSESHLAQQPLTSALLVNHAPISLRLAIAIAVPILVIGAIALPRPLPALPGSTTPARPQFSPTTRTRRLTTALHSRAQRRAWQSSLLPWPARSTPDRQPPSPPAHARHDPSGIVVSSHVAAPRRHLYFPRPRPSRRRHRSAVAPSPAPSVSPLSGPLRYVYSPRYSHSHSPHHSPPPAHLAPHARAPRAPHAPSRPVCDEPLVKGRTASAEAPGFSCPYPPAGIRPLSTHLNETSQSPYGVLHTLYCATLVGIQVDISLRGPSNPPPCATIWSPGWHHLHAASGPKAVAHRPSPRGSCWHGLGLAKPLLSAG